MNLSKQTRIARVGRKQPTLKRMGEDGVVVTEKLPGITVRRKMLFASGHVASIILADGKSVGSIDKRDARPVPSNPENTSAIAKLNRALENGALFFSECPYGNGSMSGKKACEPSVLWRWDGNVLVEDECCKHIKQIAADRKAAQVTKEAELAARFESAPERFYKAEMARRQQDEEPKPKKPSALFDAHE